MDGGAGLVVGMSCGFGGGFSSGIGAGIAAGRKKAREEICEYALAHRLSVQDRRGKTIPLNQFLDKAMGAGSLGGKKTSAVAVVALGIVLLAALILFLLLM